VYAGTERSPRRGARLALRLVAIALSVPLAGCSLRADRTGSLADGFSVDWIGVDPSHPQVVYAMQLGTLYRSADGGAYWHPLKAPFPGSLQALAIAPHDPKVRYAGIIPRGYSPSVFVSTDGGASWRSGGLTGSPALGGREADDLAVDPHDPRRVYAVETGAPLESHVFATANGGRSWHEIGVRDLADRGVMSIAPDPHHPGVLYASTFDGVFESTAQGVRWRLDGLGSPDSVAITQVVADPRRKGVLDAGRIKGGVETSSDSGRTWRPLALRGQTIWALAASPTGRVLYAGTENDGVHTLALGSP
jgi:hypothetical protein